MMSFWTQLCLTCCLCMACVGTVIAQPSVGVDRAIEIERLRQQQSVNELALLSSKLADVDQAASTYASINEQLLMARSQQDNTAISLLAKLLDELIVKNPQHVQWPLWVLLGVEIQFYDVWAAMPLDPSLFVRFGYATPHQQAAVFNVASQRIEQLTQVRLKLSVYPAEVQKLLAQRCGYLLSHCQLLTAMTGAQDQKMVLLKQAQKTIGTVIADQNDAWQMRDRVRWLELLVLLAMEYVPDVSSLPTTLATNPATVLTHARLLGVEQKPLQAQVLLEQLADDYGKQNRAMQLLVADASHRLWAKQRHWNYAFAMYLGLLKQKNPQFNQWLGERWLNKKIMGEVAQELPDAVLLAIATHLREQAKKESPSQQKQMALASSYLIMLKNRPSVTEGPMNGKVLLQWALLTWEFHPQSHQKKYEALSLLAHLVETSSDDALVYQALTAAYGLCSDLMKINDATVRARTLSIYQPLARVLFEKFATSELADNSRLFDVITVRLPAGEHALALKRLVDMPVSHEQFWLSVRYQLGVYSKLNGQPDWQAARIRSAVMAIRDLAVNQYANANTQLRQQIKPVVIRSLGMLWQMAASQKQWTQAAAQLTWFETADDLDAKIQMQWLSRRLVSLHRAEDYQTLSHLGMTMLNQYGHASYAAVVQMLHAMDQQLDEHRLIQLANPSRAINQTLTQAVNGLAQATVKWALRHITDEQQIGLLKLIWAKSLRDLRQCSKAITLLEPMVKQFGFEPSLVLNLGECHFQLHQPASYQQASRLYHQLITQARPDMQGKFSIWYWHAWARYLQICDATGQHTTIIASRINSLLGDDATLGGEPYQDMLLDLKSKYAAEPPELLNEKNSDP